MSHFPIVLLNAVMLSVNMLIVILNVIMLSVMLSVMLNVIMFSVVMLYECHYAERCNAYA